MHITAPAVEPGIAVSPPRSHKEFSGDDGPSPEKSKRWQGWQITILGGTIAIGFSLVCNIAMLIVGLARYDSDKGRGHLSVGSCESSPKINTALHVLINILSALLLGASNAAMQCLSAPTRANLDALHARGAAADIGISGFRNLRFMSPLRRTLWALLLLSSLPLHLLYNSVVTSTITTFRWRGFLVSADFVQHADWNHNLTQAMSVRQDKLAALQQLAADGNLVTLSQGDCIQTFSGLYAQGYASVLMVADRVPYEIPPSTGSLLAVLNPEDSNTPTTNLDFHNLTYVERLAAQNDDSPASDLKELIREAHISTPLSYLPGFWTPPPHIIPHWALSQGDKAAPVPDLSFVDHCLAERIDNLCTVDTLPAVQGLVVFANVVKLICLLVILFKLKGQPLITIGDAIASYLSRPDETTRERGMIDMTRAKTPQSLVRSVSASGTAFKRHRWFRGVSVLRWTITGMMCIGYWLTGIIVVSIAATSRPSTASIASGFGKGGVDGNPLPLGLGAALDSPVAQTVRAVIFANCFQLLLSIAYFQYNGAVTALLLSREFTNFARDRKGLRVSIPRGAQRRTFWLSLPYSYSVPLLVLASLLHWLLSEAIFYQEIAKLEGDEIFSEISAGSFPSSSSGTYLSIEPLFVLLVVGASCMLIVAGLGFRRYAGGIPIVRSNSLAISAACHPRVERAKRAQRAEQAEQAEQQESTDATRPIQWGVRGYDESTGVADLGFSSEEVDPLDPTLVQLDAIERALHRAKGVHVRVMSLFRRSRKGTGSRFHSESTEGIMMHETQTRSHSKRTDGRNGFSYAPLQMETAYDPHGGR